MNKSIVLNPKVGDRVKHYVFVPDQNIGTTSKKVYGEVIKINRTTFVVEDRSGATHKISKEWHPNASFIPKVTSGRVPKSYNPPTTGLRSYLTPKQRLQLELSAVNQWFINCKHFASEKEKDYMGQWYSKLESKIKNSK